MTRTELMRRRRQMHRRIRAVVAERRMVVAQRPTPETPPEDEPEITLSA